MSGVRIPMLVPVLCGKERAYLDECIDSTYVSSVGPFVARFEDAFAAYVGARFAVACASGTAALHLAMLAVGVDHGDDVLASDLTFIASVNPVRYCGARVTLVDSEERTWNLDPELIGAELRKRAARGERMPAAIVAVHVLGHPAELEPILDAAAEFGVPVVEDAAEALGATWTSGGLAGLHVGTAGRLGAYSFNGNKVLTTGGGGMVVTDDAALADRVRHLASQARLPGLHYVHDMVGFNYRLSNLAAALGMAQLEQLDTLLARKRAVADRYDAAFAQHRVATLPPKARGAQRSAWLYSLQFDSSSRRDAVGAHLRAQGIETRPVWDPVHRQLPYRDAPVVGGGDTASHLADCGLSLPSSANLSDGDVDEIAAAVAVAGALPAQAQR